MRTYTQISSGSQRPGALAGLTEKLTQLDIHVTAAPLYQDATSLWQTYSSELKFYKSIAKSSFHIIYNNDLLRLPVALQILYAMYKKRPIIMIGRPQFSDEVDPQLQKIFELHVRHFYTANLVKLEFAELSFLLNKLKPTVDYKLSAQEETVIICKIREHLYDMVGRGIGEMNAPLR